MKSELDQIIDYYETEKNSLEFIINECVKEMEYSSAHKHFKALRQVNGQLRTLYNLKDPGFESKDQYRNSIAFYEKLLNEGQNDTMKDYYNQKIVQLYTQLKELNEKKFKPSLDGQELDDLIYEIVEKKISGFKFHLNKEENLYIEFRRIENNSLMLSFTPFENLKGYSISNSQIKSLKSLGFYINDEYSRLDCRYDLNTFSNSIKIKTLISRILFDVYYYKIFDNPAKIEVIK